jgi:hypothetical protein
LVLSVTLLARRFCGEHLFGTTLGSSGNLLARNISNLDDSSELIAAPRRISPPGLSSIEVKEGPGAL